MLQSKGLLKGFSIQFHHEFFCIYRHHKEIANNGILFNNVYQQPFIWLQEDQKNTFLNFIKEITEELKTEGLRRDKVIVSYLKIFLVLATRLKLAQQHLTETGEAGGKPMMVVQQLRNAIEENFRLKHSPSDYADLLNISTNALARITKNHFNKTLTDLITERIIVEAKRELYLTNKTVKEIAYELGYDDEFYFSRFFKGKTDTSPQFYRDNVGFNKGAIGLP